MMSLFLLASLQEVVLGETYEEGALVKWCQNGKNTSSQADVKGELGRPNFVFFDGHSLYPNAVPPNRLINASMGVLCEVPGRYPAPMATDVSLDKELVKQAFANITGRKVESFNF
jgi:prepilin-type processing-associated H-X9-DG protein